MLSYSEFPAILKELRDRQNLTQEQLASALGVTQQTVGKWEKGITVPRQPLLMKIAAYFHVSTDYILGNTDAPSQPPAASTASQPLTPQDRELLRKYHELDPRGKQAVLDTLEREHSYTAPQIEDKAT